jgi:hypothetical protein
MSNNNVVSLAEYKALGKPLRTVSATDKILQRFRRRQAKADKRVKERNLQILSSTNSILSWLLMLMLKVNYARNIR